MRIATLNAANGGINRMRTKGGASETTFYDLENCYIDASGRPVSRPGTTEDIVLPSGTYGLCAFEGKLVVFATSAKTISDTRYVCEIIINPYDATLDLREIHYAGPFLGYLYVVAEFEDGSVYHYWLQARDPWTANTTYSLGDVVEPTTRNGYAYRATVLANGDLTTWAPGVARTVGDVVQPTVANGFKYTVTNTIGTNPKSGTVEPTWPAEDGATVTENVDLTTATATTTTTTDASTELPPTVADRYSGRFGIVSP